MRRCDDPAEILPSEKHKDVDAILSRMNFSQQVYDLERQTGIGVDMDMKELTHRVISGLATHRNDLVL